MKKILIITDKSNRHFYFVNQLILNIKLDIKVISNAKVINRSLKEIRKRQFSKPLFTIRNKILNVLFKRYGEKLSIEKHNTEKNIFIHKENFL